MDMSIRFPHLGIELPYVGKAVTIFGFDIAYYGIIITFAILSGIWSVILEAKRSGQNQDEYLRMLIVSLIMAIIGARIYYVIFSWDNYQGEIKSILNLRGGGYAIYGGLLGGILGTWIFCKIRKASFWKMADTCCTGLILGQAIGQWGSFFNREAFGEYTDSLLAMQLPVSAVRLEDITDLMQENLVSIEGIRCIQVHPVFFYEFLWDTALFCFLVWYRRRKPSEGELFGVYLAGYSLGRVWMEGLRADRLVIPGYSLPISQILSAVLAVVCIISLVVNRELNKKRNELKKRRKEDRIYDEGRRETSWENSKDAEDSERNDSEEGGSDVLPGVQRETGYSDCGVSKLKKSSEKL